MARPKAGYYLDGKRIPGVTTIIGRFKDSGGLLHWACKQGQLIERGEIRNLYDKRDEAGEAGTVAHDMIEAWKAGVKYEPPAALSIEQLERAEGAFQAFLEWSSQSKLEIIKQEQSLVSTKYRFGGTLDAIVVNGKRALADWKTSNGVYPDYVAQLAAYDLLWEENFPNEPIDGGYHLIRFSKTEEADDPVHFSHHFWNDLSIAREYFLHARKMYDLDKRMKKMV